MAQIQGKESTYSLDLFEQINLYRMRTGMKCGSQTCPVGQENLFAGFKMKITVVQLGSKHLFIDLCRLLLFALTKEYQPVSRYLHGYLPLAIRSLLLSLPVRHRD